MNKRIFYTNDSNIVQQVHPAESYIATFDSEDEALAAIIAKDVPENKRASAMIVDQSEVPDRKFRDAWEQTDSAIIENMTQARAIHLNRIREYRNAELVKEDINFQKALEANDADAQSAVATKKQTLRDLPETFNLSGATNGAELNALWPSELPTRPDE